MKWDYSTINHWWIAFGDEDRVWKITVTPEGMFKLTEGTHCYCECWALAEAKESAELQEHQLTESIHA